MMEMDGELAGRVLTPESELLSVWLVTVMSGAVSGAAMINPVSGKEA